MAGLIKDMFQRFMARQDSFFNRLSSSAKERLIDAENKYAELRITGPEGGLFYFQYKEQRLFMIDKNPKIAYEKLDKFLLDGDMINYPGGDEVFFDVIDGDLSPREAISHKYFRANTEKIIYDTEEFAQAFEQFLEEMRMVLKGKRQ